MSFLRRRERGGEVSTRIFGRARIAQEEYWGFRTLWKGGLLGYETRRYRRASIPVLL